MKTRSRTIIQLIAVWLALLILLAITVASSFVPLGAGNSVMNGAVAIAKTGLIALFFMHLRHAISLVRLLAIVALVTISLLFVLAGVDYITRITTDAPWQSTPPSLYASPPR